MDIKKILKNIWWIFWLNKKLKVYNFKKLSKKLKKYYNEKSLKQNFVYSEKKTLKKFHETRTLFNPKFKFSKKKKLKVFWVGANRAQDESGFLQALEKITNLRTFKNIDNKYGLWWGKKSNRFKEFDKIRDANDRSLIKQVKKMKSEVGLDLLIGQMWANFISKEALSQVREMGVTIINLSMDDRLPEHWTEWNNIKLGSIGLGSSLDLVLTTSKETCLWYGLEGVPALFFPLGSDSEKFKRNNKTLQDIDVIFIGNKYGIRPEIINYLLKNNIKVDCYGNGWKNGPVNAKENISFSKRAKIILGVGTVGYLEDLYTMKLRDFDAMMTGALYITHRNPDLEILFKEGKDIEYYSSKKELLEKIKFYLKNGEEREKIGVSGQKIVSQNYNWEKRLTDTFNLLKLTKS